MPMLECPNGHEISTTSWNREAPTLCPVAWCGEELHTVGRAARSVAPRPPQTPQMRADIAAGRKCRYGHDMTATLDSGKPVLYVAPNGTKACRLCKIDAANRHKEKNSK